MMARALSPWILAAAGAAAALLLGMTALAWYKWGHWKDVAGDRGALLDGVVAALTGATGNKKLTWETASGQIVALGESNRRLKLSIDDQSDRIDAMAAEAVRLRATAGELKKIADRAEAQRQSALKRLSDQAITPGTRADCLQLLREAEDALNLVYEEGA